jgi:hypothetical protein
VSELSLDTELLDDLHSEDILHLTSKLPPLVEDSADDEGKVEFDLKSSDASYSIISSTEDWDFVSRQS